MSEKVLSKKDLKWQCRRGMLELDLLFNAYLEQRYEGLSDEQKQLFSQLLSCTDPELFAWLLGQEVAPEIYAALINDIKQAQ